LGQIELEKQEMQCEMRKQVNMATKLKQAKEVDNEKEKFEAIVSEKELQIGNLQTAIENLQASHLQAAMQIENLEAAIKREKLNLTSALDAKNEILGKLKLKEHEMQNELEKQTNAYSEMLNANNIIKDTNKNMVMEKDIQIGNLQAAMEERDIWWMQEQERQVKMEADQRKERDIAVEDAQKKLEAIVTESDLQIFNLRADMDEKQIKMESIVTEKEHQIENLQAALKEREGKAPEDEQTLFQLVAERTGDSLESVYSMVPEEREQLIAAFGLNQQAGHEEDGEISAKDEELETLRLQEKDLNIKLEEATEKLKCKICMDRDMATVFQPCGHFCCCQECAKSIKRDPDRDRRRCPICKSKIENRINVFIP
jgi:hypothetical protein